MGSKSYVIPKDEMETDITVDYTGKTAYVYSCYYPTVRKLKMLAEKYPEFVTVEKDNGFDIHLTVPISWIRIAPSAKRTMSAEAKQRAAENLKRYRESKESA